MGLLLCAAHQLVHEPLTKTVTHLSAVLGRQLRRRGCTGRSAVPRGRWNLIGSELFLHDSRRRVAPELAEEGVVEFLEGVFDDRKVVVAKPLHGLRVVG